MLMNAQSPDPALRQGAEQMLQQAEESNLVRPHHLTSEPGKRALPRTATVAARADHGNPLSLHSLSLCKCSALSWSTRPRIPLAASWLA